MVQVLNESGPPLLISESDIAREQLVIEGRGPSEGRSDIEANEDDTITGPTGTFGQDPESRIDEQAEAPERSASDDGCTAAHGPQSQGGYVLLLGLLALAFIARRRQSEDTPVQ